MSTARDRSETSPIPRLTHILPSRRGEVYLLGIAALFVSVGTLTLHQADPSPALTSRHLLALLAGWSLAWGMTYLILRRYRPRADLMLLPTPAMMTGWGLLILARLAPAFLLRQILWLLVGSAALVGVAVWTALPRLLRRYRYTLLVAGTLLLGTTLIFGVNPSGYGQRLWLGAYGIYFQPSELLKLLLIIYLAAYLAERRPLALHARTARRLWMAIFGPMLTMFGVGMLLLGWQQDLGAALLFYLTFLAMLYLAWGKAWHVTVGLLLAVPIVLIGVHFSSRVALRVSIWLNPWAPDQADRAFQLLQSLFALAAGGVIGQGLGLGLPTLIPAVHTDFVYAALVEEFGIVGAIGLILLLALYVYRSITLAQRAEVPFESLLAGGIGAMVAIQSWVILAGATKLIPLTGVTLPFLSYGGSSLLLMMVATGIQLNLSAPHLPPLTIPLPPQTLPPLQRTAGRLGRGLLLLLLSTALSTGTWSVWRAEALRRSPQNPRHILAEARIRRGAIYDRADRLLAGTTVDADGYAIRTYPLPEAAPVVGYATLAYGTAGIEATCNARLRGDVSRTPWARLWDDLRHRPPVGESVRLTLDATLQQRAQQALAGRRGAVVLLDVHSGEILALASAPTYNPATVEESWETLRDDPQAPLLNRATQGLAQPGAILESIVLATALQQGNLPASPPALTATVALPDMTLSCSAPPPTTTWTASLSATCPAPIASLAAHLDPAALLASLDAWGLTAPPPFDLPTVAVPWPPADVNPVREALGQGELLVTPLHMALAAATVGNDGLRLPPRLIWGDPDGCESPRRPPPTPVISPTVAATLRALWPRFDLAIGHEGTALAGPARTLTWFIGLDTPDTPRYAIAVLIEGEPPLASQIGTALLRVATTLPCRRARAGF